MRSNADGAPAAVAAAAPLSRRVLTLALACSVVLTGCNEAGVNVSAFSAPYRASSPPPPTSVRGASSASRRRRTTRLPYKHLDDEDHSSGAAYEGKNETAIDGVVKRRDASVRLDLDVNVGIKSEEKDDVIFYNDLEVVEFSSGRYKSDNVSAPGRSSSTESGDGSDAQGLIHELEDAIKTKNINIDAPRGGAPKAIEPSASKPAKKFVSPIQLIKKVPKVDPISMSTVFFLKLIGDPMWPSAAPSGQGPPTEEKKSDPKKPVVESWKTKMQRKKSTAFQATNYLESLSASAKSDDSDDGKGDDLLKALRDQRAQLRQDQLKATQQAFIEANRRTNPKEVIERRWEEEQAGRKRKEREKLEMLYVERKERLDAKRRNEKAYLEERAKQKKALEEKAREREEAGEAIEAGTSTESDASPPEEGGEEQREISSRNGKRGIPVLDVLSRQPVVDAPRPPLLVGSTLTLQYSDLTPFQRRSLEVARGCHKEHCERMKVEEAANKDGVDNELLDKAGDEGGIQAAPIVAVIDSYTAAAAEDATTTRPKKRYATLASVEMVGNTSGDDGEPFSAVKLMGVGRVFLHDYFSSKDVGSMKEEEELSKLLAKIQELDRDRYEEEDDAASHDDPAAEYDEDENEELPVVMAEFDIVLDDSSILSKDQSKHGEDVTKKRTSPMHAITELYRTANKVYRLHEERKKLVAGVRAGVARLRLGGKKVLGDENCFVEFEDCDGLGLVGCIMEGITNDLDDASPDAPSGQSDDGEDSPIRSRLEKLDNYGFGSYGILSTVPDLTKQLATQLRPYYSPAHREREEYDAELASMVAFRTLQEYASPEEVARALLAPTATERLELGYEIMMRHVDELNELVRMVSKELIDCGEECTDLW